MSDSDIIRDMVTEAPDQSENIANSISQVEDNIAELTEKRNALRDGMMTVAADDLQQYLDGTKLAEFQLIDPGATVDIGPNYDDLGYGNLLDDWRILDSTALVMYSYYVNWDSDPTIVEYMGSWDFANDYITHPLIPVGASYGLDPNIANLGTAKTILENNKDKVDDSETALEPYAS